MGTIKEKKPNGLQKQNLLHRNIFFYGGKKQETILHQERTIYTRNKTYTMETCKFALGTVSFKRGTSNKQKLLHWRAKFVIII